MTFTDPRDLDDIPAEDPRDEYEPPDDYDPELDASAWDEYQAQLAVDEHDAWCRAHPVQRRLQALRWRARRALHAFLRKLGLQSPEEVPF